MTHAEAAVDRNHRTGDIAGPVRGQPRDRSGDFLGSRESLQRNLVSIGLPLYIGQGVGHVGLDKSGGDDVGGDAATA